jgi:autotransporter adhesin
VNLFANAGATAIGFDARAGTTAVGQINATAIGSNAAANALGGVALGANTTASGDSAIAIGLGATAGFDGSIALGRGVTTARAGQVLVGTAGNTYTLPGITSAASLAAQTGATNFVTTDANGNLAASSVGPGSFASAGSVAALSSAVSNLAQFATDNRNEARRGIAAAAANAPLLMPSAPGRTTVSAKVAGYRGQAGAGVMVAHRLDLNLPAVIFGSYSNGGGREHIVSGGAGIEF